LKGGGCGGELGGGLFVELDGGGALLLSFGGIGVGDGLGCGRVRLAAESEGEVVDGRRALVETLGIGGGCKSFGGGLVVGLGGFEEG
jgi:hypothetical protein